MGAHLERARERLRATFLSGLAAKIDVLELARRKLINGEEDAVPTIVRVSHQIAGSAGTYGYPELTELARQVEQMTDPDVLGVALDELLTATRAVVRADGAGGRILIVEAHPREAELTTEWLAGAGHESLIAATVAEARTHLLAGGIDLVVLSLDLFDEDGRYLLLELRRHAGTGQPAAIVVSAQDDEMTREECVALGAVQFLAKPVDRRLLLSAIAAQVARDQKSDVDDYDALTGMMTRAPFTKRFEGVRAMALRTELPLSVGLIDLDRFKEVNDTYGHAMGDTVLRHVSAVLVDALRVTDHVARWGGEEFLILLPSTSSDEAIAALDRAREALAKAPLRTDTDDELSVTFSGGVVEVERDATLASVIERADALMYMAKATGRDHVLAKEPDEAARRPRILLAEDDAPQAALLDALLTEEGYAVEVVVSGTAAIEAADRERFAMLILDGMMPGLTGFEVLEQLRRTPGYRKVPILMLTVLEGDANIEQAFALGADDFLEKPFRPRQLLARVNRMIERSAGRIRKPTSPSFDFSEPPGGEAHNRRRTDTSP